MTVLSVVKDVCLAVGVNPPTTLFGNSVQPRTRDELLSLANEMAQRIAYDNRDWQTLFDAWYITKPLWLEVPGKWISTPLPNNFKRLQKNGNVWKVGQMLPLDFIPTSNDWTAQYSAGTLFASHPNGFWQIWNNKIYIGPVPADDAQFRFDYVSKNCIQIGTSSDYTDAFQGDNDNFIVNERLLKLGMIWQWKANKGSPYAEDMSTFYDAMSVSAGSDQPAPIIVDKLPISSNANVALPWPAGWGPQP